MKKEILIGTGLQGITVQFLIQDIIVMKDAISMNDGFIDRGKDFRAAIEQLTMMNQFLKNILEGTEDVVGLFEAHKNLFLKPEKENEL